MKMVALIPARAGSKRIPGKNTRELADKPLIAWTLLAAYRSNVFSQVIVCTDDRFAVKLAMDYEASYLHRQPVADDQPDIDWVRDVFEGWKKSNMMIPEAFAILRPTAPFRTADTIRRAYQQFARAEAHSLRAVQPVKEHPYKMWSCLGAGYPLQPLFERLHDGTPGHSQPTQTLPKVYIQNASLEMAWSYVIPAFGTISGRKVAPFFTEGYEGFDLNTEDDWREAERLIEQGTVALPSLVRL